MFFPTIIIIAKFYVNYNDMKYMNGMSRHHVSDRQSIVWTLFEWNEIIWNVPSKRIHSKVTWYSADYRSPHTNWSLCSQKLSVPRESHWLWIEALDLLCRFSEVLRLWRRSTSGDSNEAVQYAVCRLEATSEHFDTKPHKKMRSFNIELSSK